jgi:cytochrome c peroxidase
MRIVHPLLLLATLLTVALALGQVAATDFPGVEGYEPMSVPADNPVTPGKIALGRQLFFDKRLSGNSTIACASCHMPKYAMTQGPNPSRSVYGEVSGTACPTLVNIGHHKAFFWEGSGPTLEDASHGMWMFMLVRPKAGRPTAEEIAQRLNAIPAYRDAFQKEFGVPADPALIGKALATFLRTITSNHSPWMRFYRGREQSAISAAARRGYALFDGKASCSNCHSGVLLTDLQYHNVGVGSKDEKPRQGRFEITKVERDRGAFKTPTLLNVARTAPYFHDHSVKTLEAAVDQMLGGGIANPNLDRGNLRPVQLTPAERRDLLAFLRSLNTDTDIPAPNLP